MFLDGDVDLLGEGDGGAHAVGQDEGLVLLAVNLEEVAADLADLCKKWGRKALFRVFNISGYMEVILVRGKPQVDLDLCPYMFVRMSVKIGITEKDGIRLESSMKLVICCLHHFKNCSLLTTKKK